MAGISNLAKSHLAQPLSLFIPITKIDIEKRLVYGIAADETPDHADEVFDYQSSKPLFEKWSGEIAKNTDGKSKGNIRSMHSSVAAGKVQEIEFDDTNKAIPICAKVVDPAEWDKVQEGVYTGFSIGGKYVKRWVDTAIGKTRYTAQPTEISLVDLPCNPAATFSMIKADGIIEERHFKIKSDKGDDLPVNTELEINKDVLTEFQKAFAAGDLAKAFSFEEIRDRVRGAINEKLHTPFNCGYFWIRDTYADHVIIEGDLDGDNDSDLYSVPYTMDAQGVVTIDAAGIKQVKVEYTPTVDESDETATIPGETVTAGKAEGAGDLAKGESVDDLSKSSSPSDNKDNEEFERITDDYRKELLAKFGGILKRVEIDYMPSKSGSEIIDLAKAGAVHSKSTLEKLSKIHHDIGDMGGACKCDGCKKLYGPENEEANKANTSEDLQKASNSASNPGEPDPGKIEKVEQSDDLQKMMQRFDALEGINAELQKSVNGLKAENESLSEQIKKIADQPMPGGPIGNAGAIPRGTVLEKSLGGALPKNGANGQSEIEIKKAALESAIAATSNPVLKQQLSVELATLTHSQTLQYRP